MNYTMGGNTPEEIKPSEDVSFQEIASVKPEEFSNLIEYLQESLHEETDQHVRKQRKQEIEELTEYKRNAKHGFKSDSDKAWNAIQKALKRAADRIIQRFPELKEHFLLGAHSTIDTSFRTFAYREKHPVNWILDRK